MYTRSKKYLNTKVMKIWDKVFTTKIVIIKTILVLPQSNM